MSYGNYPDLSRVKRVLVIKMRHHGDVLLTSPLFSNLQKALPNAVIDAFIYKETLPMLEGHPAIHSFHLYDKEWKKRGILKRISQEISHLRAIRSKQYDLVINLTEGDRGAIVSLFSKAFCRVGFDPKGKGFFAKKKAYTHLIKICPHPRHMVERQLDALRRIGIFPCQEERDLYLSIPEEAKEKMRNRLQEAGILEQEYILIHPVSRWRFKCLSIHQMKELIFKLHKRGEKIVISSGPDLSEKEFIDTICSQVTSVPVLNLSGKTSLKELAALIQMSKALISVDSVPLHIASATKTPLVVAFGPTSEQNWGPWMHPQAYVVSQTFSCRPCYQDGCGGSKMSDCLFTLPVENLLLAMDKIFSQGQCASPFKHM